MVFGLGVPQRRGVVFGGRRPRTRRRARPAEERDGEQGGRRGAGARKSQGRGITVCTSVSGSSTLSGDAAMYAWPNFAPICHPQ